MQFSHDEGDNGPWLIYDVIDDGVWFIYGVVGIGIKFNCDEIDNIGCPVCYRVLTVLLIPNAVLTNVSFFM